MHVLSYRTNLERRDLCPGPPAALGHGMPSFLHLSPQRPIRDHVHRLQRSPAWVPDVLPIVSKLSTLPALVVPALTLYLPTAEVSASTGRGCPRPKARSFTKRALRQPPCCLGAAPARGRSPLPIPTAMSEPRQSTPSGTFSTPAPSM